MSKGRYFCGGSALAVTMALAIGAPAMAQDVGAAFRAADKNNDGKLDAAEFDTLPTAIKEKAVDANGDGFYTLPELTPATTAETGTEVRAVVSVGTYLKSGSEDTALNVEATSRDDLLKTGSPAIGDLIRSFSETGLNDNGDNRGQNAEGYGVRTLNLRNLGSGRTLILFDGVRLADDPQTNGGPAVTRDPNVAGGGAQNLNNIPMEVLQSVEVLKDGGSAAYGGDAAGGAVNFAPRRDLNGFEASVNYKYIQNSGYYDANIQWGKRQGSQNFLFSAFYSKQLPLAAKDRKFVQKSFVQNDTNLGWGPWDYNVSTYAFGAPATYSGPTPGSFILGNGAAQSDPLLYDLTPGIANKPGGIPTVAGDLKPGGLWDPTQAPYTGQLRDDACLQEGGTRNWSAGASGVVGARAFPTPIPGQVNNPNQTIGAGGPALVAIANPVCGYARYLEGYFDEDTDTFRLFQDATINMTDNLRYHVSTEFVKTQVTIVGEPVQENAACDPWPENAPSFTVATSGTGTIPSRRCTDPMLHTAAIGGPAGVFTQPGQVASTTNNTGATVPGYNPALRDYMLRYYANPIVGNTNGQRVFSDAAINTVTGCPVGTVDVMFNCSATVGSNHGFVSDSTVMVVGRSYSLGNGSIAGNIFTPGTTSAVTVAGTTRIGGISLGQGYVPADASSTVTVNVSTTTTPINITYTLNGGVVSAAQGVGLPNEYGRVLLVAAAYGPFITMYNSAFKGGEVFFNSQNINFTTTQDIKGDLGEKFGNNLDFTAKANYSRNLNRTVGSQMMTDRFQRALDGFGTDLTNLGGDKLGCTAAETTGTRLVEASVNGFVSVTGVPYTVGAGGGGDYDSTVTGIQKAEFGFDPGVSAGNGCYFFNPFDSAIRVSRLNHAKVVATNTDVGFVGANTPSAAGNAAGTSTTVGALGSYQGYAPGMGLENSPGLVKWMFQQRDVRSYTDQILLQGVLNGEVANFQLPGGSIDWDIGTQYLYVNRDAYASAISDSGQNPCPFLRQATQGYLATDNIVNATSTCSGTSGLFSTQAAGSLTTGFNRGPIGAGAQDTVNHSLWGELQLPVLKNFNLHTIGRYEEYKDNNSNKFRGDGIYSADAKWQAFDSLSFVTNVGQTFNEPVIQQPGFTTTFARNSAATTVFFTGSTVADINNAAQATTFINTALGPQHGFSYGFGAVFQTKDRASQVRVQFFSDDIQGSPSGANNQPSLDRNAIARALTGNTVRGADIDITKLVDCNDPLLSPFFKDGGANGLFGGAPFVEFTDGVNLFHCGDNSAAGGPTITTFTISGVDVNGNGTALDTSDLALAINVPNVVNGGDFVRQGVELNVNHRVRPMVFGGILSLNADMTWNLKSKTDDLFAYGIFIASGTDNIGTLNDGFSNNANIWAGTVGFNYQHGKHNLRMSAHFQGPVVDNSGLGLAIAAVPTGDGSNLNPADTSKCDALVSGLGLPFAHQPITDAYVAANLGDILVGEQNRDINCNRSDLKGYKSAAQVDIAATYQVQLPQDVTLTISVDNLLNTKPPYQRFLDNYNPFSALSADLRTVKFGLQKKF